jgi:predicted GTPase
VVVVAKTDAAAAADVERVVAGARRLNPGAPIVRAASPVRLDDENAVRGKRVLVVEDGPTTTHGGMPWGAGYVAAKKAGADRIVDPRPFASGEIAAVFAQYPHIGPVLPAMGYSDAQLAALAETIDRTPADVVVVATPIDLRRLIAPNKQLVRARYEFREVETPKLQGLLEKFLRKAKLVSS